MLLIASLEYSAFPLIGWHGISVIENAFPLYHLLCVLNTTRICCPIKKKGGGGALSFDLHSAKSPSTRFKSWQEQDVKRVTELT